MKHVRLFGLLLVAVFAVGALASSAFALPEFLVTGEGKNSTFSGSAVTGTSPELENSEGTKVKCTAAPGSGGFETDTLGTFHIEFTGCTSSGFECKTEADKKAGVILSNGSFHFVYDTLGTGEGLGVAIMFLTELTEFTCAGFITSKVFGTLLCLILKPLTSSITHEFHCTKGTKKGEAGEKKYWNDNGTIVEAQLLSKLNGAAEFKESNELALATITTPKASAFMNE